MREIEKHPFGFFVPKNIKYLILGSFPTKEFTSPKNKIDSNAWFYGSSKNDFWRIMEHVYKKQLKTKKAKQQLLRNLKIGITDVIYSCRRTKGNNSDQNLASIKYNTKILDLLYEKPIEKIFFTSSFVEKNFYKTFRKAILTCHICKDGRVRELSLVNLGRTITTIRLISPSRNVNRFLGIKGNINKFIEHKASCYANYLGVP